ncbi:hypothetical protein [Enterobacter roggenkampii]|uniref:hypothetical protein n=1 Tax=Enterobacter roggenkampii TaxID=1812935 RepID=UPI003EBFC542
MKKLIIGALVLAGVGVGAQQAFADSVNEQVNAFRTERHFLDRALTRCTELVAEKYQTQLYGLNAVNGEARKQIEAAAAADKAMCRENWTHKSQALFEQQSPEVKAFYKQRSAELKVADAKLNEEAAR